MGGRHLQALECAMTPVYRDAGGLGPRGRRFAEEIRRELKARSEDLEEGDIRPLKWDLQEDGLQVAVQVLLARDGNGTRLDVLSSAKGRDGKERATQSVLLLNKAGRLLQGEAPHEVLGCVGR